MVIKDELNSLENRFKDKQNKVFDIISPENEKHGSLNVKSHATIYVERFGINFFLLF